MSMSITNFIIRHPGKVIAAALLLAVFLASGMPKLTFEEDIKDMIPKDMPSRKTLNELEEIFGGSDVALIGIGNEEESIFNVRTLRKIKALTDSLDVMPDINRVTSLATVKYMEGHDWGLEVTPYLEEDPVSEKDALRIREMFFKDSTYVGILVSGDGNYAAVIAQVDENAEIGEVHTDLTRLAEQFEGPEDIYMGGMPIVTTILSQSLKKDLRRLIPFVIGLIIVLLFISFRSVIGVILPLSAVILSLVCMLGFMGHIGIPFTSFTNIMPVILLGIGIDYGIHVMANYYQESIRLGDKKQAILQVINDISTPMIMACLTTMVGFLSLLSSPLEAHHQFGYLLAFGIFMALLFNMTFVPAFLSILPPPRGIKIKKDSGFLDSLLNGIGRSVIRFRHGFAVLAVLIVTAAFFGIPKVNIEMNPISFFPDDTEVVRSDRMINRHLGGSVNMNVLFEGNIQSAEVLNAMNNLEAFIDSFPETGSTMSLATVVRKINKSLNDNDPAYDKIPDSDEAIAQAILVYSMSGDPRDFENLVDNSYEYGQVVALLKSSSTQQIAHITTEIEQFIETNVSKDISVKTTGFSVFFKELAYMIITSQVRSISFATILVFIIAWVTYLRFLLGFLVILPFAMCVILNFGIMGFAGIDLSIPMAMISSMIIGIGVDFSFHLISRFKLEICSFNSVESVKRAVRKVGEPILYSALTTACGGLVLTTSGFIPVRYLGFMLALIMIVCAFLALTVLSTLLSYAAVKK